MICVLSHADHLICALSQLICGWRIHGGVEDTKFSTNKQHTLSLICELN